MKETWQQYCERIQSWHPFFVWWPMKVDGIWYWLDTIQRRAVWVDHGPVKELVWEYRDPLPFV